jgi:hydroxyacylglutathione hydrolase
LCWGGGGATTRGARDEEQQHRQWAERDSETDGDNKCGHEYTKSNVRFAKTVSQTEALSQLESFAGTNTETTGVFTIGDEKKHNVFMRVTVVGSVAWVGGWLFPG